MSITHFPWYSLYELSNDAQENIQFGENNITLNYPCVDFEVCNPYIITLVPGVYIFELWGAQGGSVLSSSLCDVHNGGLGGYSAGKLQLQRLTTFYIFIGAHSKDYTIHWENHYKISYNGGGYAYSSPGGGGATDVRLTYNGDISSLESLHSRIMVSGGGGGAECYSNGGGGGGIIGGNGSNGDEGGRQDRGGNGQPNGEIWLGGSSQNTKDNAAAGGGGYFGGGHGLPTNTPGGGGSSYISGHEGCKSFNIEGEIVVSSIHYSKLSFTDTYMFQGGIEEISPYSGPEKGREGHGMARITIVKAFFNRKTQCHLQNMFPMFQHISAFTFIFINYKQI